MILAVSRKAKVDVSRKRLRVTKILL